MAKKHDFGVLGALIRLLVLYVGRLFSVQTFTAMEKGPMPGGMEARPAAQIDLDNAMVSNPHQVFVNDDPHYSPPISIQTLTRQTLGDGLMFNEKELPARDERK